MTHEVLFTLEQQVEPQHTALLIVDPQKDFCDDEGAMAKLLGWNVSPIQTAVQHLNQFIQNAREAQSMIIWIKSLTNTNKARPSYKARNFKRDALTRGISIVKEGSDGADWYSEVTKPLSDESIVTKWHYDAFEDTNLELLLNSREIKTLLLTGFATNICVETTARHGYIKGYYIVLVSDCTAGPTQKEYDAAVFNIQNYFGKVAKSTEIVNIWNPNQTPDVED